VSDMSSCEKVPRNHKWTPWSSCASMVYGDMCPFRIFIECGCTLAWAWFLSKGLILSFFWQMLLFTVIFIVTSFGCRAITGGLCYTVKYSKVVPSCLITLRSVVNKTEEQAQEELPSCELFKENDHDRVFPRGPLYRQVV